MNPLDAQPLLDLKEFQLVDKKGIVRTYFLSQFDCITGLEIVTRTITSGIPKFGDFGVARDMVMKTMCYVGVQNGERIQRLTTDALVINHIPNWEMLITIFKEMMKYNSDFFQDGRALNFFEELLQTFLQKVTAMFTQLSQPLSTTDAPPSTSSEPSTA